MALFTFRQRFEKTVGRRFIFQTFNQFIRHLQRLSVRKKYYVYNVAFLLSDFLEDFSTMN